MMKVKCLLLFSGLLSSLLMFGQKKVLHYTETSGFNHGTRVNSFNLFQQFASQNSWIITDDMTGANFDNLSNLLSFDLIVFSNTSGNAILDSTQRSHFEQYIQNGGALLGIHAATDTYRHSTANGGATGTWDFYAETIGGSVQQAPNHVAGTPLYSISKIVNHPITDSIPDPWNKNEEYYYWENGYLNPLNNDLLKVEETVGPNGMVNDYDSSRTVAWYRVLSSGSKVFYTSLGHANSNFTSDTLFQRLILDASKWCLNLPTSLVQLGKTNQIKLYPNPTKRKVYVENIGARTTFNIYNSTGKRITPKTNRRNESVMIDMSGQASGYYIIEFIEDNKKTAIPFILDKEIP